ncbi:uncharacterized protein LOC116056171 [Sander lucioperca]|uniref:uncharacterized protein LOC116056171 n=1 Tax=Sander lucioperca TaxID=283035 RepID=UPI0016538DA2|nr:uncharacterized protein LOC116056171 [Sander lucioperca]
MTEHHDSDEVTFHCSVSTYGQCQHTVKWRFKSQDVDELSNEQMRTSQYPCYASMTVPTSHFSYTSRYQFFRCEVTEGDKVQEFPFSPQSSGEKPGEDTKTTTTTTTESLTTESSIKSGTNDVPPKPQDMLVYIIVALVLVALLIIIVAVISWKKTKGNTTQKNDKVGLTSNSEATQSAPETSQDTADPGGGVSYASISHTKKTGRAQVRHKNDDDAVTYTTVKASSADPSDLYATIN